MSEVIFKDGELYPVIHKGTEYMDFALYSEGLFYGIHGDSLKEDDFIWIGESPDIEWGGPEWCWYESEERVKAFNHKNDAK